VAEEKTAAPKAAPEVLSKTVTQTPESTTTTVVVSTEASEALKDRFVKLSGYKASDLIGSRGSTRTFVTSNGGKYQLNQKGNELTTLQGPPYPKEQPAEAEEEEEAES